MMDSDSRGMVVCCVFLGIPAVLLLSGPFIALHDAQSNICGPVQQDFIFLGSTCNITNISHTATIIGDTQTYCKDGGAPDEYDKCGSGSEPVDVFNEEPISSGCEDRYTIYFTAGEDNHSVVHRSITRQRLRGVEDCGDSEPLQSTYVVGYKTEYSQTCLQTVCRHVCRHFLETNCRHVCLQTLCRHGRQCLHSKIDQLLYIFFFTIKPIL